jgi:hypothetical protein
MTSVPESGESSQKLNDQTEANIEKAIRFWQHPSLMDIPSDQKRQYLNERGVTDEEIHKAWQRIAESEVATNSATNASTGGGETTPPLQPQTAPIQPDTFQNQLPPTSRPTYPPNYAQSSPQYYGQHPPQEEDDGPLSLVQGVSLVTLGGMIGLTAAAASRWLNGGDFEVLPGPKYPPNAKEQRSLFLQRLEAEQQQEEDGMEEEEEDDVFLDSNEVDEEVTAALVQEKLLQQVESIAENLKSNVEVQEKILKKLISNGSSITDQSMNLLRSKDSGTDEEEHFNQSGVLKLWIELVEIKAELRSLYNATALRETNAELEEQAKTTLGNLEKCIEQINSRVGTTRTTETAVPATNPPLTASTPSTQPLSDVSEPPDAEEEDEPIAHTLKESIRVLAEKNDATALRVGSQLLFLYIVNLSGMPDNSRYRKIFTSNESFKKVEVLKGAKELLFAVGFEEQAGSLEWLPNGTPEEEALAMEKLKEASAALGILKSGKQSNELTESALAVVSPSADEA